MMSYEQLLSQLTEEKLNILQGSSSEIQEGVLEEEQAAAIQNVQQLTVPSTYPPICPSNISTAVKADSSNTSTPQRKISASSRFMSAFQQFYSGNAASAEPETTTNVPNSAASKGVESKLLSMWHNVKYSWSGKIKSNFSKEQPVWILGRCYHRKYSPTSSMENSTEFNAITSTGQDELERTTLSYGSNACENLITTPTNNTNVLMPQISNLYPTLNTYVEEIVVPQEMGTDAAENQVADNPWEEGIEGFRRDFFSRIWLTYRHEFPTMNGSNYTSDCGWGCMIRSGQMLLSQGLVCHFLGRSWRYDPETQLHSTYEDNVHRKIIKWFGDSSSKSSPFSIHALVSLGEQMGKKPGDWYGPASVSYLMQKALRNAAQENADFDNITIYVARDCTVYMQDLEDLCRIESVSKSSVPWRPQETPKQANKPYWKSVIILIPLRLGTEKLNIAYAHCLKLLLSTDYCIGIIGGRPKHSLYFVGFQEDKLIHLDPHYCQEMVDVNQENFSLQSFHCKSPRKLKTKQLDPSSCIGFYCQTKTDFDNFIESVQMYLNPLRFASGNIENKNIYDAGMMTSQSAELNYPLFSFARGRCLDHEKIDVSDTLYCPMQQQVSQMLTKELLPTQSGHNVNVMEDDDGETEEFVLL